jgi:hypothetical protein
MEGARYLEHGRLTVFRRSGVFYARMRRLPPKSQIIFGLRPEETNDLNVRDVHAFKDEKGRKNYRLVVRGKTGERDVIIRSAAVYLHSLRASTAPAFRRYLSAF